MTALEVSLRSKIKAFERVLEYAKPGSSFSIAARAVGVTPEALRQSVHRAVRVACCLTRSNLWPPAYDDHMSKPSPYASYEEWRVEFGKISEKILRKLRNELEIRKELGRL